MGRRHHCSPISSLSRRTSARRCAARQFGDHARPRSAPRLRRLRARRTQFSSDAKSHHQSPRSVVERGVTATRRLRRPARRRPAATGRSTTISNRAPATADATNADRGRHQLRCHHASARHGFARGRLADAIAEVIPEQRRRLRHVDAAASLAASLRSSSTFARHVCALHPDAADAPASSVPLERIDKFS